MQQTIKTSLTSLHIIATMVYADVGFEVDIGPLFHLHIDKIAEDGIIFSNGYVSHPYCSPSRAGLMTGRYQQRFGHEHNVLFSPQDSTMGTPKNEVFLSNKIERSRLQNLRHWKMAFGRSSQFFTSTKRF